MREKADRPVLTPRQRLIKRLREALGTEGSGETEYRGYVIRMANGRYTVTSKFTNIETKQPTLGEVVDHINRNRS